MTGTVLVIGGTGMLGRPVVRAMLADGFAVRVFVRDRARAMRMLGERCELVVGDVFDHASLMAAMRDVQAVHVNLATPFNRRVPNTDLLGARATLKAALEARVPHLLRISAMGVPAAAHEWWSIRDKDIADRAFIDSGIPCTILRPTWFMESLPLFALGPFMLVINSPDHSKGIHWLAAEDYARQVIRAIKQPPHEPRIYDMQGPECVDLPAAARRFASAARAIRRLIPVPLPLIGPRMAGLLLSNPRYLVDLIDISYRHTTAFTSKKAWDELGKPTMTIEDYARSIARTGDWPKK